MKQFLMLLVMLFAMSATSLANPQEVSAIVSSSAPLSYRLGPGTDFPVTGTLESGDTVTVKSLKYYDEGWVFIMNASYRQGFVPADSLRGNYAEIFPSEKDETSFLEDCVTAIVYAYVRFLYGMTSLGWWSFLIVIMMLALSSGIIYGIRRYDKDYQQPWIYYVLYFITLIPTFGMFAACIGLKKSITIAECVMSFLLLMVFASLAIFGGWGVRQCGMIDEKYHKNGNRYVGQLLQFPVWIFVIIIFWMAALEPIVDWSTTFVYHGGGFWRYILGLIIPFVSVTAVLFIWIVFVVPYAFKTAGNWPVRIMLLTLWITMAVITYNWAYANFNSLSFVLFIFIEGACFLTSLVMANSELQGMRCSMCHNCHPVEISRTDDGYSEGKSSYWTTADQSEVGKYKKHFGSTIEGATKRVQVTTLYHNWTTILQCPNCGRKWSIAHSDEVDSHTEDVEYKWKERY